MYCKIKNKIILIIRIINVLIIFIIVKGRFFDNFLVELVGFVIMNKKYLISILLFVLCYYYLI